MATTPPYPSLRNSWVLPLRLITFCVIVGVIVGWLRMPSYLQIPLIAYGIITLAALVSMATSRRTNFVVLTRVLTGIQFAAEILCEAGIVYTTGNLYSPFSILFLLTIVSASIVYRLVGTLIVASLVSLAYSGVIWINAYLLVPGGNTIPTGEESLFTANDILFYSTFLQVLIFYLVAFISGYLAQILQSKDRQLHTASTELRKVQLDTGDILRYLNCGLITVDMHGDIVYFNRMAEGILDLREEDVSGRHYTEVFTDRLQPLGEIFCVVLNSEVRMSRTELVLTTGDGNEIPIGVSSSVLRDEHFGVRGVITIFQDLTEAKRLEEKMRQADRMAAVGELSACIAHEIRNPLASISGAVEVLKSELSVSGDEQQLMSLIVKESARLNNILSDFLMYARVGRRRFHKVELTRILSDVIDIVRRHPAYHEGITLDIISRRTVTYIAADEDQVKQLLLNLAVNACEAMDNRSGKIEFEIIADHPEIKPNTVVLAVRDNGPGIDPEVRDKIFLPFHSTKRSGTGLGLSIVSRLMETLDGRIDVHSTPGQGTEFSLSFRAVGDEAAVTQVVAQDMVERAVR